MKTTEINIRAPFVLVHGASIICMAQEPQPRGEVSIKANSALMLI